MKRDYFNEQLLVRLSENNLFSEFIISTLYRTSLKGNFLYFSLQDNPKIRHYIESIIWELKYPQLGSTEAINSLMILLFTELMRLSKEKNNLFKEKDITNHSSILVMQIIEFIYQHFMDITLKDTATHFHIHPNYLTRLLKKYIGKGFMEMVQQLRMEKAEFLLQNTTLTITEIARECGFSNINYFYHLFKKTYHKTPNQLRKQLN